jgi:Ca-activated chloride channel family protein
MIALEFLAPTRLLLLAVPLVLLGAYLLLAARRRRYTLRFTQLDLLDEVAPDRPGWRRHVPALVFVIGTAVAVLAAARPAVAVEKASNDAVVILAIDTSLSMEADDVDPSRVNAAKDAALRFVDEVPDGIRIGVVGFHGTAQELLAPTDKLDAVRRTIDRIGALGEGTAIGDAVVASVDALEASRGDAGDRGDSGDGDGGDERGDDGTGSGAGALGAVVLLSDGETTNGLSNEEAAAIAREAGVPVTTIAFGTDEGTVTGPDGEEVPVPVNRQALAELASSTEGRAFEAATAEELRSVYEDLGRSVQREVEQREVTDVVVLVALGLLVLAAAGSLRWAGRLP